MLRTSCVWVLALFLGASAVVGQAQDKKGKADATKQDKAAAKGIEGTLVKLDVNKGTITIKTDDGNKMFTAGADSKVFGQRGGLSRDGLEDERLDPGAKVRVVPGAGGKAAAEIHIVAAAPAEKAEPTKDATKAPPKTAAKKDATPPKTRTTGDTKTATKDLPATGKDARGLAGKIAKVDADGKKFTVDVDGKRQDYTFDDDTTFVGPRGGVSKDKAKDDRFVVGATVQIEVKPGTKAATTIHLPYRNSIGK